MQGRTTETERRDRGNGNGRSRALQDYEFARLGHKDWPKGETEDEAGESAQITSTKYE